MSNIRLDVPYQLNAISTLKKRINFALDDGRIKEFNFKSCVASGKTVMCGLLMQNLFDEDLFKNYTFMWISTSQGNLCKQSKENIENVVSFKCLMLDEALTDGILESKTCIFVPWEQINRDGSVLRGKAEYTTMDSLMQENSNPIILFVDEAHDTYGTEKSDEIIELINPRLCIKVSATPKDASNQFDVEVDIDEVISAGFIKKNVEIQKDLINEDDNSVNNIIMSAIRKQKELEISYKKHSVGKIPLCLIQIANDSKKTELDDKNTIKTEEEISDILKNNGVKDSEIAIWLSEKKTPNIYDINNNGVRFLIIKQAVAKGWDCPRAHILVRLRETKSVILDIQTLGRVLRTIDKNVGHYNDDIMDSAYIYTNDPGFKLSELNNIPVRINTKTYQIKDEYRSAVENIKIPSSHFYKNPPIQRGDNLYNALERIINKNFYNKHKVVDKSKLTRKQLLENSMNVSKTIWKQEIESEFEKKDIPLSDAEIEKMYENRIKTIYSPFSQAILDYMDEIADKLEVEQIDFYKVVISNFDDYIVAIKEAVDSLKESKVEEKIYSIPGEISISTKNLNEKLKNYAYDKGLLLNKNNYSDPEIQLINYLENNDNVLFWIKNIERNEQSFCIAYDNTGGTKSNDNFYPDFLVLDKTRKLWILETKGGSNSDIDKGTASKYTGIVNYRNSDLDQLLNINETIESVTISIVRPLGEELKIFDGESYISSLDHIGWKKLII